MKITIHQTAKVAGGYEYFYSVLDDEGEVILGNQFHFCGEKKPDEKATAIWITAEKARVTALLSETETVDEDEFMERYVNEAYEKKLITEPTKEKLEDYIDSKVSSGLDGD